MRGAFYTTSPPSAKKEDKLIDFFIMDPSNKIIHYNRQHEEGMFRFNTTMKGTYKFVFANNKDRVNIK